MSDPKKTIQSNSCLIEKKKMDQLDKLSNLPTGVTHQILSYLPIKQAVRTSILSSDWRYKWAQLPCLVFDDKSGYPIAKVVDHVLLLHSGRIDTFKLSTFNYPAHRDIDKWIAHLSRNNVKVFVLKVWKQSPYNVFSGFFSFKDLTHLELCNCLLKPPTTFEGFRMLKSLHLQEVKVSGNVLGKLIACCPRLERIILCDLRLQGITDVTIDAPSIQFLKVQGSFEDVLLTNTFNLVDVSIDWKQGSRISSGKLLRYFFELPCIERLTLEDSFLECAVGSLTKKLPKPCPCLNFLSISIRLNKSEEILTAMHLLRSAPALQELDILVRKEEETNDGEATYCSSDTQNWEVTQLRRVKVTGFSGVKAEVDFIEFLLLTSPGLQELEISFCQDVEEVNFSWLDNNLKTCAFTQLRVVKVTGFSGVKAQVDFIRFLLSSTSQMLESMILQPAFVEAYWELVKLLPTFRRDSLQCRFKVLGPIKFCTGHYYRKGFTRRHTAFCGVNHFSFLRRRF